MKRLHWLAFLVALSIWTVLVSVGTVIGVQQWQESRAPRTLGAIDIRDVGADSSGTTSSHAAMLEALDQLEDFRGPGNAEPSGQGEVVLAGGDYLIDDTITLGSHQKVRIAADARILLPRGFSGTVFRFTGSSSIRAASIGGDGQVLELGKRGGKLTRPGRWTFVEFTGNQVGVASVDITGLTVWWPGTFARYRAVGEGWVNAVNITGTRVFYPRVLLDTRGERGADVRMAFNRWEGLRVQAGSHTQFGVKALTGRSWTFDDVVLWDPANNPELISARLTRTAEGTTIIGGNLSAQNFIDRGQDTVVIDRFQPRPWDVTTPEAQPRQ